MKIFSSSGPFAARALPALLCGLLLIGTACISTRSQSSGSPSAVIAGNTPGQITDAAHTVFRSHGYEVRTVGTTRLIAEKKTGTLNSIAYGNWTPDSPVWERVKTFVEKSGESSFRIRCQSCLVRDRGGLTEEEVPMSSGRKHRLQKLMDEVAAQLKAAPGTPPAAHE